MKNVLIIAAAALAVCIGVGAIVGVRRYRLIRAAAAAYPEEQYLSLCADEKCPERFEPYLKRHPTDCSRRIAALVYYGRHGGWRDDLEPLRHHTFKMIEFHPDCMYIHFENNSAFYAHPEYRSEVIERLEEQVEHGHTEHETYANLAWICEKGAIPPALDDPESRERFLSYFGLPEDTAIPKEIDNALAEKAVGYFRAAIKQAGEDAFHVGFYTQQFADMLVDLGRTEEALKACEHALPRCDEGSKAGLLLTYGRCLRSADRSSEAVATLKKVRALDHEGFDGGPGHCTVYAETLLGEIALEAGDVDGAAEHLIASCKVERCCHTITQGLPRGLAKKLVKAGRHEAVIQYCKTVLETFTPDDPDFTRLLSQATESGRAR